VWDAGKGTEVLALKGHTGGARSVAFSPDGARLASAGDDGTVRVWDARSGADLLALKGHTGGARSVAFSPDGARLASAGADGTVRVWDARTGVGPLALKGHNNFVTSVAFSPDGSRVFAEAAPKRPGERGPVRAWDVRTGAPASPTGAPALPPGQRLTNHKDGRLTAWASGHIVFVQAANADHPAAKARQAREDFWDTVVWRRQQASAAEEAGDWSAALFHLDCLRHLRLDRAPPHPHRTHLLSQALQRDPRDVRARLAIARAHLHKGDLPAYRAACAALAKGTSAPEAAWVCALGPNSPEVLEPFLKAAAKGAADNHPSLRAHGALLLRAGRHADALKRLDQALKARGPHATPAEELLIALAYHKLGRADDARLWLARARAWMDRPRALNRLGHALSAVPGAPLAALPGLAREAPDPRELLFGWQAWLDVQVLRREAEALLGEGARP
jgi:tetratricopeptide (TPR) repeat protein